ncbi:hypothetical protein [Demequina sp. NBRC 110055]|uniref:LppM family (lipo)protein n=1 Tax=Demequina sp. NBRC 110055 TaxID=1570344 RepID=UPI0011852EE2|nr:hypothetical protein [Demequina sp. NBRC 110055]
MTRATRTLILALVAALALAGCLRVDMDVTLNEDDTVSGTVLMAVQSGAGDLLGVSDDELIDQMLGDVGGDLAQGDVSDYAEDGYVGKQVTFDHQPFSALDFDSDELSITREGDDYLVEGSLAASDDAGDLGELPSDATMTLSLTFPGDVTETNGELDSSGHTVTWDLLRGPYSIEARGGARAEDDFPLWIVLVIGLFAGVGAGIALVVATRRRRGPSGGEATPDTATPGMDAAPTGETAVTHGGLVAPEDRHGDATRAERETPNDATVRPELPEDDGDAPSSRR